MLEQMGPLRSIGVSAQLNSYKAVTSGKVFYDTLVSRQRGLPLLKLCKRLGSIFWDFIKVYFLFCFYDPERDAQLNSAYKLDLFFNRFLDAQAKPTEENASRIKAEFARLPPELHEKIKDSLLRVIKEQMHPGENAEYHQKALKKILENPFTVYENDQGHEPCVMGQAIARAKESLNVIV